MIQALMPILASVGRAAAAGGARAAAAGATKAGSNRLAYFALGRMSDSGSGDESNRPANPEVSDVAGNTR